MGRLIELLIVVVLALIIWRLLRDGLAPRPRDDGAPSQPPYEPTVRCSQCGTHVPRSQVNAAGLCRQCSGVT